jgi:hypothetical protein
MHDKFLNKRPGTFFVIAILDGIFFALRYYVHHFFICLLFNLRINGANFLKLKQNF